MKLAAAMFVSFLSLSAAHGQARLPTPPIPLKQYVGAELNGRACWLRVRRFVRSPVAKLKTDSIDGQSVWNSKTTMVVEGSFKPGTTFTLESRGGGTLGGEGLYYRNDVQWSNADGSERASVFFHDGKGPASVHYFKKGGFLRRDVRFYCSLNNR